MKKILHTTRHTLARLLGAKGQGTVRAPQAVHPIQRHGNEHQGISMSPSEKSAHFAALMTRLNGRSEQERLQLQSQAAAAILGHEAYALGHQYLSGGNYLAAEQWLRVAAGHSVPGAEQDLKGIKALLLWGEPPGENPQLR